MMPAAISHRLSLAVLAGVLLSSGPVEAQDFAPGEKLTLVNCGRCHVIGPRNRMGGIGSTPSFPVLRTFPDWESRMKAFWTLRPHPSFTQIEGMTEPFAEDQPPHVHPIRLTMEEVGRIVDYVRTVEPANLGSDLGLN